MNRIVASRPPMLPMAKRIFTLEGSTLVRLSPERSVPKSLVEQFTTLFSPTIFQWFRNATSGRFLEQERLQVFCLPNGQRDDKKRQVLRTHGPRDVAFSRNVFQKHNSARAKLNLTPSGNLDFAFSAQCYDILPVRGIVPILDLSLRQTEELSF